MKSEPAYRGLNYITFNEKATVSSKWLHHAVMMQKQPSGLELLLLKSLAGFRIMGPDSVNIMAWLSFDISIAFLKESEYIPQNV